MINDNGNKGNPIIVRLGRPGSLGSGAFGLVHFTTDHNLSDDAVATVIANNAAPQRRSFDNRWLYGLTARLGDYSLVTIEVVVDPSPSVDGQPFGVVTAYCLGPTRCPDGIDQAMAIRVAN
ncbi:hypothetical protein ACQEVB_09735 [Pseudonocardia sp. CA-107938]|uniref:hypothetical protein n=1 Tax=Pseudonocardia sp. CA-107938 TaxID=3240021 RepID=UPI003D9337C1